MKVFRATYAISEDKVVLADKMGIDPITIDGVQYLPFFINGEIVAIVETYDLTSITWEHPEEK